MTAWLSAAVIGGGIAGTTAALALAKIGADVEVYEATTRTTAEGGWVTLGPSAITALDQLGVGEQIRAVGFPVVEARMMNTVTGREDRLSRYETSHRWSSTHVWRRDLLSVLRDRLDQVDVHCHFNTAVTAKRGKRRSRCRGRRSTLDNQAPTRKHDTAELHWTDHPIRSPPQGSARAAEARASLLESPRRRRRLRRR